MFKQKLINKVKNLFNECKIDVKKIVSYEYARNFLNNDKDDTLCVSAYEILNGANKSEVMLTEGPSEKHGIFDKIFNFLINNLYSFVTLLVFPYC